MEKNKNHELSRNNPVASIKGVGPVIARAFAKKGIESIDDLVYYAPIRWLDRGAVRRIDELVEGEGSSVIAVVDSYRSMFYRHSRKKGFEVIVGDGTGFMSLKWFRWTKGYLQKICVKGNTLLLSGKVGVFNGNLQMVHPEVVVLGDEDDPGDTRRVLPLYSQIDGVKQGLIRRIIREALENTGIPMDSVLSGKAERSFGLVPFGEAVRNVHMPRVDSFSPGAGQEAVKRLILEEYLHFQITLASKKRRMMEKAGISFKTGGPVERAFMGAIGFELTHAQHRVVDEIRMDMAGQRPMNRLLQGDVGSGKTVCAVIAACIAIDNGCQVALMAPTEILAEQHYFNVHRWFDALGVPVVLLKGGMGRERKEVLEKIREGATPVVIGTHAVIQQDVEFRELGLVIIDEQHRFGVEQRKKLKEKSLLPDVLSMTATPIPRTLSMVIYGDLDVSVIDEMPDGRQKVWTKVLAEDDKKKAHEMVMEELEEGRGAYIVYPLVEGSQQKELRDATSMASHLQRYIFPDHHVGLLHGRMKARDKEEVMNRFRQGQIDVLVCTTVIEVGIDVPGASMIVIENAERFGLSQLHQLRGRVGRGAHASKCLLVASTKRTNLATKRLKIMEKTNDGFAIAEEDLKLRGVGDMLGVRQSGLPQFRIGDIVSDVDIMIRARKIAEELVSGLSGRELEKLLERIGDRFEDKRGLSHIA